MTGLPLAPLAAAAGDAATARRLAAAGVDVVVAYHSSALRRRGQPSVTGLLPWANANDLAVGIVREIAACPAGPALFATVCANDALRPAAAVMAEMAASGVVGVLNAPTVGLFTGPVRDALEAAGLGFAREIELMAAARKLGLRAWGYAFNSRQALAMAAAGAEAIVVHLGLTGSPAPGARHILTAVADAVGPEVRVLVHGGPIGHPAAFTELCAGSRYGFFGASVFELATDIDQTVRAWRRAVGGTGEHAQPG